MDDQSHINTSIQGYFDEVISKLLQHLITVGSYLYTRYSAVLCYLQHNDEYFNNITM